MPPCIWHGRATCFNYKELLLITQLVTLAASADDDEAGARMMLTNGDATTDAVRGSLISPASATASPGARGVGGDDARVPASVDPAVSHPSRAPCQRRRPTFPAVVTCAGVGQPRLQPSPTPTHRSSLKRLAVAGMSISHRAD